jgi:hypothetical protein
MLLTLCSFFIETSKLCTVIYFALVGLECQG